MPFSLSRPIRAFVGILILSGTPASLVGATQAPQQEGTLGRGPLKPAADSVYSRLVGLQCEDSVPGEILWPMISNRPGPFAACRSGDSKTMLIRDRDSTITGLGMLAVHVSAKGTLDSLDQVYGPGSHCTLPLFPHLGSKAGDETVWQRPAYGVRLSVRSDTVAIILSLGEAECGSTSDELSARGRKIFRDYLTGRTGLDSASNLLAFVELGMMHAQADCPAEGGCLSAITFGLDNQADSSRARVLYEYGGYRMAVISFGGSAEFARQASVVAVLFLNYLRSGVDSAAIHGSFNLAHVGHWSADSLPAFATPTGITFFDVNNDSTWHATLPQLNDAVKTRSGPSFKLLAHLGFIYAQPYRQYSELTVTDSADVVTVSVAGWYRIVLEHSTTKWRVTRIEYRQIEDK